MNKPTAILIVAILLMGSALSMGIYLIVDSVDDGKRTDGDPETDDSLGEDAKRKWREYSGRVKSPEIVTVDPGIARAKPGEALEKIATLEGLNNFTDSYEGTTGGNGSYAEDGDNEKVAGAEAADDAGGSGAEREVEEADLVKVIGDTLYVLNSYRGLVTVDISDPENARMAGRCPVLGYPEEMYVVDFLAIITVRTDYNFWYWYWEMSGEDEKEDEGTIGTMMYIVNVDDIENPVVLKIVELEGFPGESRRVGHVIYQATNTYDWYWYGNDGKDETMITSIDFGDPETLGMKDQVRMEGSSNQVHASPNAFYVASPVWDYDDEYYYDDDDDDDDDDEENGKIDLERDSLWEHPHDERYRYFTEISYLDISDPHGKIETKDTFIVPGYLEDKYQMDEYEDTFRLVTHFWKGIGESRLYIVDILDPDNIKALGTLLIDDEGSLMATRFAGERAYTIHLPRSIDPLDVLDLSDPEEPELCDVFEMPGWVTHMEVMGMKILALGVDDSEGQRNIAVSLFDVTDPYEAKMLERVRLGGNYSWSEANWEPKALTVDETHNILIVPFNSYDTETWESTAGLQMVSFDLEEGDLELKGHVYGRYSIERTRVVGDWILATSFKSLQVVDIGNLDEPRVEKVLDLCVNVKDIVPSGDLYIQTVQDWYDGKVVLRTVRGPDDLNALDSEMLGSNWARLFDLPTGPVLAANVPEDGKTVGKLFAIDVGVDGKIDLRELGRLKNGINFRDNHYNYYWYGGYYYDDVMLDVEGRCSEVPGYPMRDSDNFHVLGNTLVYYHVGDHPYMNWVYHEKYGRYAPRSEGPGNDTLFTFDLGDHSDVPAPGTAVIEAYSFRGMASHGDHLYIHHRMNGVELYNRTVKDKYGNYSYEYLDYEYFYRNYVLEIDLSDPSGPVIVDDYNIPGELIGAGEGVIFTMSEWNMNGEDNVTLNTLSLHDGRAEILTAVNLGPGPVEAVVYGDRAYIVSGQDQYYYYYYPRYGGDGGNITVRVLDLSEPETPGILASLSIEGNMELQCLDERHMCLFDRGESELVVYSIEDLPELEFTTMLRIRDRGDVRLYEDSIYVMQGYYGVLSAGL